MCGFIAQLVEHRTGIAEVTGSNLDETTFLTSLSWCNSCGVNSIHHCHYSRAPADSKFDDFCLQCIQFE